MNWSDLGKTVADMAPELGTAILGPAGTMIGGLIAATLGVKNDPNVVAQALKTDPDAAIKLQQLANEQALGLATLQNQLDLAQVNADTSAVSTVNETMRTEVLNRKFGWRDYWGYISGTGFGFVTLAVIYIVVNSMHTGHYEAMVQIPNIIGAFSALFGIAATVLGVQSGITAHHLGMVNRTEAAKPTGGVIVR